MKFKQLTFFKYPSFLIDSSEYGSPIRWDDWCSREADRIPGAKIVSQAYSSGGGKYHSLKIAIFREV